MLLLANNERILVEIGGVDFKFASATLCLGNTLHPPRPRILGITSGWDQGWDQGWGQRESRIIYIWKISSNRQSFNSTLAYPTCQELP